MNIVNDYKDIIDNDLNTKIGRLWFYMIDKMGNIKYIIFLNEKEEPLYVRHENIVSLGDDIKINCYSSNKPSDLETYEPIYPDTTIKDIKDNEYGNPIGYDINDLVMSNVYSEDKIFPITDLVDASHYYLIFKTNSPEPSPKPTKAKEMSFKYNSILGKIATKSIYSCTNTPIIVEGESVGEENIVSAVHSYKLIELINNCK